MFPFMFQNTFFNTFLISCIYIVYVVHMLSTVCEYKYSYLIINFFPTLYTSTFLTETTKKLGPEWPWLVSLPAFARDED